MNTNRKTGIILTLVIAISAYNLVVSAQTVPTSSGSDNTEIATVSTPTTPAISTSNSNESPAVTVPSTPSTVGSNAPESNVTVVSVVSTPVNSGSNSSEAGTSLVPTTGGSNTAEAGTTLVPTTGGSNSAEAGTTLVPTTGGSNSDETSGSVTPPVTPPANNGGGGGSSSGSYSSGGSSIFPIIISSPVSTSSCPLIDTYMKFGAINNPADVSKLQAFLKNSQGFDVDVNGTFDQKTENAVEAFQSKYLVDVMGPWQATRSSGIVYITTKKKINELACNAPFILSSEDMSIINSYIENLDSSGNPFSSVNNQVGQGSSTSGFGPQIGDNTGNSNVAAVIRAPILQRIWDVIVNFFKRIF